MIFRHALAAALLAGCAAGVHWEKPGASPETLASDFQACSTAADAYPILPRGRTGPTGVELEAFDTTRDANQRLERAHRVERCMRQRGYTLRSY